MRTRYVNRTIKSIVATCTIFYTDTKEIGEEKIVLPSGVTEKKLEKEISSILAPNKRLLEIVTTETVESYYRMTENDFIANATIVPAKAVKSDDLNEQAE